MGYIIVQDSRLTLGKYIALIDKNKTTIQGRWWTSIIEESLVFESKEEADKIASKYKYNNPRVVPFDLAKKIVIPIVKFKSSQIKRRKNIFEMTDWEYKSWLGYSDVIEYGGGSFE